MTKTKTKLSRNAKRTTARRRAQKEQQKKRSGGFSINAMLAGQNNPSRREPGAFLTDGQRQQLQKAGRDIHGELLPYVEAHTFGLPAAGKTQDVPLKNVQTIWEEELEPLEVPSAATNEVYMTESEFEELKWFAKKRKRGLRKTIEKDGWSIIEGDDPTVAASWHKEG